MQLNVKNLQGVQQQLEHEINIMTDLLDQTETKKTDRELYTTYDATIALQSELTPLLDRVHSLGLFPFVQRLTPMEKLTLERLGFKILPDASSASSFLNNQNGTANHYLSENTSEEPAPLHGFRAPGLKVASPENVDREQRAKHFQRNINNKVSKKFHTE